MTHHLLQYPSETIVMPMRYYGSIAYYASMAAYGHAVIDADAIFDKRQKAVHRCDIADTHGPVQLTVPVCKPHGIARARWSDVAVSDHGAWWHVHRVTLESAYGRSPFFEFYIDRFLSFLTKGVTERYPTVASLNLAIDAEIRSILLLETAVSSSYHSYNSYNCYDRFSSAMALYSRAISPYWQVRGASQGFIANLSILDLIFNLGPEAPLYLRSLLTRSTL